MQPTAQILMHVPQAMAVPSHCLWVPVGKTAIEIAAAMQIDSKDRKLQNEGLDALVVLTYDTDCTLGAIEGGLSTALAEALKEHGCTGAEAPTSSPSRASFAC